MPRQFGFGWRENGCQSLNVDIDQKRAAQQKSPSLAPDGGAGIFCGQCPRGTFLQSPVEGGIAQIRNKKPHTTSVTPKKRRVLLPHWRQSAAAS